MLKKNVVLNENCIFGRHVLRVIISYIKRGGLIMFCSNCGAKLDDDAKFCSECGQKIGGGSNESKKSVPVEEETELAHAKIGLTVNRGMFDSADVGTGILTNKRLILKQASFMGITHSLVKLLTEGKTVFELPYEDIKEAHIKKKMLGNILVITTNSDDVVEIFKQGMSSSFLDEWCDIINSHIS